MNRKTVCIIFLLSFLLLSSTLIDLYNSGLGEEKNKNYLDAIDKYLQVIEKNSNFFNAYYHIAICYYELEKYPETLDFIKRGYKLEKNLPDFLLLYAKTLIKLKQYDEAYEQVKVIKSISPTYVDLYFAEAEIKIFQNKVDEAFLIYSQLLQDYPFDWKVNLHLYYFYRNLSKENEALQFLQKAMELAPYEPSVYLAMVKYHYENSDITGDEYLGKLLSLDPKNKEALILQSMILLDRKDPEVTQFLDNLQSMYPYNLHVLWLNYQANKGSDSKKAVEALIKANELYPQDEIIQYALEEMLVINSNETEYVNIKKKLAQLNYKWSLFYYNNGQSSKGEMMIRRAIRIEPFNIAYRTVLADIYKILSLPFLQLEQYLILSDLGTSNIKKRIEVLEHFLKTSLERKNAIKPYSIKDSFLKIGIFYKSPPILSGYYNLNYEIASMIYDKLVSMYGINFAIASKPLISVKDSVYDAKSMELDYMMVINSVDQTEDNSFRISISMVNPSNMINVITKTFFSSTDYPILENLDQIKKFIKKEIPIRGKIISIEGNTAIVNIGFHSGISKSSKFSIYSKLTHSFVYNKFQLEDKKGFQATAIPIEISESLCLIEISKSSVFSRVNIGDVVFIQAEENK